MGLIQAIDRFDLSRDTGLATYAFPTMTGELKRHLRNARWMVHMPRGMQERTLQVRKTSERLSAVLDRAPTSAEIAEATGLKVEEVLGALLAEGARDPASLDAPRHDDVAASLSDTIGEGDDGYERIEDRSAVAAALSRLPARERRIVELRFAGELTQIRDRRARGRLPHAGLAPPAPGDRTHADRRHRPRSRLARGGGRRLARPPAPAAGRPALRPRGVIAPPLQRAVADEPVHAPPGAQERPQLVGAAALQERVQVQVELVERPRLPGVDANDLVGPPRERGVLGLEPRDRAAQIVDLVGAGHRRFVTEHGAAPPRGRHAAAAGAWPRSPRVSSSARSNVPATSCAAASSCSRMWSTTATVSASPSRSADAAQ